VFDLTVSLSDIGHIRWQPGLEFDGFKPIWTHFHGLAEGNPAGIVLYLLIKRTVCFNSKNSGVDFFEERQSAGLSFPLLYFRVAVCQANANSREFHYFRHDIRVPVHLVPVLKISSRPLRSGLFFKVSWPYFFFSLLAFFSALSLSLVRCSNSSL
jgi:hypothetical protein